MDKTALTRRDIDVKKIVLPEHDSSESPFGMYQVWQADQVTWFRAMRRCFDAPSGLQCISYHLVFPWDYRLTALVVAKDMDDVYGCTNVNEESDERANRIIWLWPDASSGSLGDVFVSPEGVAQYVTSSGFRPVRDDALSDEHIPDVLVS